MTPWQRILTKPTDVVGETFEGDLGTEGHAGGVQVRAPGCRIVGCTFRNLTGNGVGVATNAQRTRIEGCTFENTGMQAVAFFSNSEDYGGSIVAWNRVTNAGLDAIQVGGSGKIVVEHNEIDGCQFAGIYALKATQDAVLSRNVIRGCYGGIDVSWGEMSNRAGARLTNGIQLLNNRVLRCSGGIGTGSNGTLMHGNVVTDCGWPFKTWTLLGGSAVPDIKGVDYKPGDVLRLAGGELAPGAQPAKLEVVEVDGGGLLRLRVWYVGAYLTPPGNPVLVEGGSGGGGTVTVPQWNERGSEACGMAVVDACNCTVTGNTSGNTSMPGTQDVGFLMKRIFTAPSRNRVVDNNFSQNNRFAAMGFYARGYTTTVLAGNVVERNQA